MSPDDSKNKDIKEYTKEFQKERELNFNEEQNEFQNFEEFKYNPEFSQSDEFIQQQEWQENQYNPGAFIGTGKIAKPLKDIHKGRLLPLLIGILFFAVSILQIITIDLSNTINILINLPITLVILVIGIYGIKTGIKNFFSRNRESR